MDYMPLLPSGTFSLRPLGTREAWQMRLRMWWQKTTNDRFRASKLSRCIKRTYVLPAFWVLMIASDVVGEASAMPRFVLIDVFALVVSCCLSWHAAQTLRSDIMHALVAICWICASFALYSPAELPERGREAPAVLLVTDPVEGTENEEFAMLCMLELRDVQVKYLGGGFLLQLRAHPDGSEAGAGPSTEPTNAAAFPLLPHLPDLRDERSTDSHRLLINVDKALILACTRNFSSITGPLPFGVHLGDLVINYQELKQWMNIHLGAMLTNTTEGAPPMHIRITTPFIKRRRKFEYHAVARLRCVFANAPDIETMSGANVGSEEGICGVVSLNEVVMRWHRES